MDTADRTQLLAVMRSVCRERFRCSLDEVMTRFDANASGDFDDDDLGALLYMPLVEDTGTPASATVNGAASAGSAGGDDDASTPSARMSYRRVRSVPALQQSLNATLVNYNRNSSTPLNIVLFAYACEHVCRVCRVLITPRGHALLAGVGGTGRQSVTRLAAFYLSMPLFQIGASKNSQAAEDGRDDLRAILRVAGGQGRPAVFLLADTQIQDTAILEHISCLLDNGHVPNLFTPEEQARLGEAASAHADANRRAAADGKGTVAAISPHGFNDAFAEQCASNVHVVLAMSPVGDQFRTRLRQFPAIVNHCVIDWFRPWPSEALDAVATSFLVGVDMFEKDAEMKDTGLQHARSIIEIARALHESVRAACVQFEQEDRRRVYVTPSHFLILMKTYKRLLGEWRTQLQRKRKGLRTGLRKIENADATIVDLTVELDEQRRRIEEQKITQLGRTTEDLMDEVTHIWTARYRKCEAGLARAQALTDKLREERERWKSDLDDLTPQYNRLIGDLLLAAGVITYLGPFTVELRGHVLEQCQKLCLAKQLPMTCAANGDATVFSLQRALCDLDGVRSPSLEFLPSDSRSIDNAFIVTSTQERWPLMIDPQRIANDWLRSKYKSSANAGASESVGSSGSGGGDGDTDGGTRLVVVDPTRPDLHRRLEEAINFGRPALFEKVKERFDAVLVPLVERRYYKQGGVQCLRLGDKSIEVGSGFVLYLTSVLPNPHYPPELQANVSLIDFTATPAGLEEQLLNLVVAAEKPESERQRASLMEGRMAGVRQLRDAEDAILAVLSSSESGEICALCHHKPFGSSNLP